MGDGFRSGRKVGCDACDGVRASLGDLDVHVRHVHDASVHLVGAFSYRKIGKQELQDDLSRRGLFVGRTISSITTIHDVEEDEGHFGGHWVSSSSCRDGGSGLLEKDDRSEKHIYDFPACGGASSRIWRLRDCSHRRWMSRTPTAARSTTPGSTKPTTPCLVGIHFPVEFTECPAPSRASS